MQSNVLFRSVAPQGRFWGPVVLMFMALAFAPASAAKSKMPLDPKAKEIDTSSEGIGILVFRLENHRKEKVIPRIGSVHIHDEQGERIVKYGIKKAGSFLPSKGDVLSPLQIVSIQLPTGAYSIGIIRGYGMHIRKSSKGYAQGYPQGTWGFKLNYPFDIEKGKVVYLGRINGAIVDKKDKDDDSAARVFATFEGVVPTAIASARAGFTGGVFEIETTSAYEEDMTLLKERYPWLDTAAIEDVSKE